MKQLIQTARNWHIPPLGMPAFAAFVICVVTGVALIPVYKPGAPFDSLALLLLKNPGGAFLRSLHYWSAAAFLVLTLAHTADHLYKHSEGKVAFGVWVRLSLSSPAVFGVMLSGFLLRGDAASMQALQVLRSLLGMVPLAGELLARVLTGSGSDLTVVYLHHAATITILLWLVTIEHARRILPRAAAAIWTCLPLLLFSVLGMPVLGWRSAGIEKGPWYLVGLQELLHWLPWPKLAVWLLLIGLLLLVLLPKLSSRFGTAIRWSMLAVAACYAVLTLVGLGLRGDGWKLESPAKVWAASTHFLSFRSYGSADSKLLAATVPLVDGQREGCLACHAAMTGFVAAHDPKTVGCASCHLGNPLTLNKALAHAGMTLTPGNLTIVNRTCGSSNCHAEVAGRVRGSLMNSMSGVVAVDKYVFGESADLNSHFDVATLHRSPADTHLRQLCASCHLGQDKDQPATISESSRGGGCSACHLHYDAAALGEFNRRGQSTAQLHHPEISVSVRGTSCFGCHSRSGRIATNYEGWHETQLDEAAAKSQPGWPSRFRALEDGRVFEKHPADVHFEKGMTCLDCHLASEVMSDGLQHAHESEAVKIACADCHAAGVTSAKDFTHLDAETQQIAAMRKLNVEGRSFVSPGPGTVSYPNVYLGADGKPLVALMESNQTLQPKPMTAVCAGTMHSRLKCDACHSAWSPQCVTCHTRYDSSEQNWDYLTSKFARGAWQEEAANLLGDAPALGVVSVTGPNGITEEQITTFVPGMIMDLEIPSGASKGKSLHRLFAPASPHTTTTKARECRSCHSDPNALGYGRGKLQYAVQGNTAEWRFTPAYAATPVDGLPQDAWIGFLREPGTNTTTRSGARPFSLEKQRRILLVGACLTCHKEKEPRVAAVLNDFSHYRQKLSPRCILPVWSQAQSISRSGLTAKPEISRKGQM